MFFLNDMCLFHAFAEMQFFKLAGLARYDINWVFVLPLCFPKTFQSPAKKTLDS